MYESMIAKLPLFAGVEDIKEALENLGARGADYAKGVQIFAAGEKSGRLGVLLSGGADIVKEDAAGDPVTVARIGEGEMFGEAFAFAELPLTVSVYAACPSHVLWLSAEGILAGKEARLSANALRLFARKNVYLTERIYHLSRHTLAEKVLSYLRSVRREAGREIFALPFGRQGMADFLGCDRSALSALLAKLKRAGVIDYHKNVFRLIENEQGPQQKS